MKHSNISIFIPHTGCPHKCSFCDQHTISGAKKSPSADEVRQICEKAFNEIKSPENTEIAFFGGSFTAIPRDYMISLLEAAHEFVGENKFKGIRISTRPDYITPEILDILKKYGVTAIELGAQSMNDEVLAANERGHTAQDVINASELIKKYGFELGLQVMMGLYKSDPDIDYKTVKKLVELRPKTLRIYPVVILRNTKLAELYEKGEYKLLPFDIMVEECGMILDELVFSGIKVIKCGLHASEFVKKDMIGGYYHPAFRELCENFIYLETIQYALNLSQITSGDATIVVNDKCISKAIGQKKSNINYFKEQGINIKIVGSPNMPVYDADAKR